MTTPGTTPELLAPAGDGRALRAALAAGADAVYFGLERWSARAFAGNFVAEHAVEAVELAHLYDARAYLALNTLLKDDELEPALAALEAPYAAGLDALIVTDLGLAARAREEYPDLPLHASTQMDTHSSAQLAMLARLGFDRAILARELSLDEIAALDPSGLELEVFVHGALCYGYSGDCLLSSMVGGRSGNRGRCSQSCRMRYRLSAGAATTPSATGSAPSAGRPTPAPTAGPRGRRSPDRPGTPDDASTRVLSTGDLCALGTLPRLLSAGVTSFKIEGRMKDAAYVAVTTSVYREALDAALADPAGFSVRADWMERLEQSFSRGFTSAHLDGRHSDVRSGGRGGHRGVPIGRVVRFDEGRGEALVRLTKPVVAGDVVYLYTSCGQTDTVRVPAAATEQLTLRLRERVTAKDRLFRLSGAEVGELARDLVSGRATLRPVRLRMCLVGEEGRPAALAVEPLVEASEASAASTPDFAVAVTSSSPLVAARTVALDEFRARDAVGALGGTPYRLGELEFLVHAGLFLAVGDLKDMRRRAVAALDERRLEARRRATGRIVLPVAAAPSGGPATDALITPPAALPIARATTLPTASPGALPAAALDRPPAERQVIPVILVVRPGDEALLAPGVAAVCLDLEVSDQPEDVDAAARALAGLGLPLRCRPPEVLFDTDFAWWHAVTEGGWSAVYVRQLALLSALPATTAAILEYPLQGLGAGAAAVVRKLALVAGEPGGGLPAGVVASPEASLEEIAHLAADLERLDPPAAVEALAFGRQQVLRARDRLGQAEGLCGVPDSRETAAFLLEDAKGYCFPAAVDACGTRLFNARVTNLAGNLDDLAAAGVSACLVVQADMTGGERRAFAAEGLPGLASFATRDRATTGHLFRGVA